MDGQPLYPQCGLVNYEVEEEVVGLLCQEKHKAHPLALASHYRRLTMRCTTRRIINNLTTMISWVGTTKSIMITNLMIITQIIIITTLI